MEASKTEWDALLGRPFYGQKGFTYKVPVSVGYENENAVATDVDNENKYPLVVVNKLGFWIFAVVFIASLWGFWWLANNSGIIRDTCPELPFKKRPLSLGRAQMAFWFYVVAASYCLIWLITSNRDSLTTSALTLIGISTLTALGATAISRSKSSTEETKKQDLEVEKKTIQTRLSELNTKISAVPPPEDLTALENERAEKKARLEQIEKELSKRETNQPPQESEGWVDLISDANDVSLHRFQMAVWTLVLGIVFVASVYNSLAMPEFSGTLLALMGVSGGTYIGFKFPEAQQASPAGDKRA
jgi:hypothetical protein